MIYSFKPLLFAKFGKFTPPSTLTLGTKYAESLFIIWTEGTFELKKNSGEIVTIGASLDLSNLHRNSHSRQFKQSWYTDIIRHFSIFAFYYLINYNDLFVSNLYC